MPHITVDLQKTIQVWCMLDDLWGCLEYLKMAHNKSKTKNYIISQQKSIGIIRHKLMQACGFEDYNEFVSFIEKQDFATWDHRLNMWFEK